jgi:TPR repeat protein
LESINQLGFLYKLGIGMRLNKQKAIELFEKTADENDPTG